MRAKMVGRLQILASSALLLSIFLSCLALPVSKREDEIDPLTLIATGLLSQEKRLQAVEQKLLEMSSTPHESREDLPHVNPHESAAFTQTNEVGRAQLRARERAQTGRMQTTDDDLETRVKYLEQDVEDNRVITNHKLQAVHDLLTDLQRRESEMFQELHSELNEDVVHLEEDINSTFREVEYENDMVNAKVDVVSKETRDNMHLYYHVNDGLHRTINFIRHVEYHLDDRVYMLEEKFKEIMSVLEGLNGEGGNESPSEPSVAPVGAEGKMQSRQRVMSDAEKAVLEWMKKSEALRQSSSLAAASDESAKVESASSPVPNLLETLMHELNNYNM